MQLLHCIMFFWLEVSDPNRKANISSNFARQTLNLWAFHPLPPVHLAPSYNNSQMSLMAYGVICFEYYFLMSVPKMWLTTGPQREERRMSEECVQRCVCEYMQRGFVSRKRQWCRYSREPWHTDKLTLHILHTHTRKYNHMPSHAHTHTHTVTRCLLPSSLLCLVRQLHF